MFRIRNIDAKPGDKDLIVTIPRNRTIKELREYIHQEWKIAPEDQKLYYQGKELINSHKIIEYNIKMDHLVQLMIKPKLSQSSESIIRKECNDIHNEKENLVTAESKYYKVGDPVDYRMGQDEEDLYGAWFESEIVSILKNTQIQQSDSEENLIFLCKVLRYQDMVPFKGNFENIRPRSHLTYGFKNVTEGTTVLANVNMDNSKERGLWFDVKIKKISKAQIEGVAILSKTLDPVECKIHFVNELMKIEKPLLLNERQGELPTPVIRKYPINCKTCQDKTPNCKQCGCFVCCSKKKSDKILLCDQCDLGFHIYCLNPPLKKIPLDDWYCPDCKIDANEIVRAGEHLKKSTKRSNMPALKSIKSTREWDNGMSCVGRIRECTIVPKNHFGPIPGVDVGTIWKYRAQVSEAGIHRAPVAGIHGRAEEGAYSIVVSGGYEDDVDNGEEFEYTGAGGRDLSNNRRTNVQGFDQKLEGSNKALALNCNAKFNNKTGAESEDWREGKPVRVVRKGGTSKYAPVEGYRYDGIYKVIKYYAEKGKSGFIVWKYVLRRDDPFPAPWTEDAPQYEMIYPDNYSAMLEAIQRKREKAPIKKEKTNNKKKSPERKKRKQKALTEMIIPSKSTKSESNFMKTDDECSKSSKKPKLEKKFTLTNECSSLIKTDVRNEQWWKNCLQKLEEGKKIFLDHVIAVFLCICCQDLVNAPVTLNCCHNICKECLKRSFKAEIFLCPCCRRELGSNYKIEVNSTLYDILKTLYPGYDKGR